jgi:DNA-binding response OmpR family regulator
MRILVVEDDPAVRHVIAIALTRRGHSVIAAASSDDADALLLDYQHEPDVSLLDLMLPGLNGLEYAHDLLRRFPAIRFVFMTGWFEDPLVIRARAAGTVLAKPFDIGSLVSAIQPQ